MSLFHTIVASAILGGIVYWLIYHVRRLRFYRKAWKFSGPPVVLPILGNAQYFAGNSEHLLKKMVEFSNLYPSPYRVWLGQDLAIFVSEPEQIKKVLCSNSALEKSRYYRFFQPWLGNGLFSASAKIWRLHRKLLSPTFNAKTLESFVPIFVAQTETMLKKMEIELNGEEFQVFEYLSMCTLDIICETAMGVTMEAQVNPRCNYVEAVAKLSSIIYQRIFKPWLHSDFIFYCTKLFKDQEEGIKTFHSFTDNVIRRKKDIFLKRNHREKAINIETDVSTSQHRRKAFLELLIELSQDEMKLTDVDLRDEVNTMVLAGNDTTSNVLCFVLLMLASHPEVQDKVYDELCGIYGRHTTEERKVSYEDLFRMQYMEQVIKETLRLFPIAPVVARTVTEDLDIGEHTLPEEALAVLLIFAVHRNEEYWPDPLKFDPDRFLPVEIAKRHSYCFLPFSAGPRNCIGIKFAMMEMKTLLATFLRTYIIKRDQIIPASEIKLKVDTLLKPVDPIKLRIERRPSSPDYI